jgi:hypothetical protein
MHPLKGLNKLVKRINSWKLWLKLLPLSLLVVVPLFIYYISPLKEAGDHVHVKLQKKYRYEISIAAITKDDHPYLAEWIDYHRLIGVDHFYIYDNNDNNETRDILSPYIKEGVVEYALWPHLSCFGETQKKAYGDALQKARGVSQWISFLDTDEFIVPTKYCSLSETLQKHYAEKPLIFVNWRMFGTSHLTLPPPTLILPFLTKCSSREYIDNKIGKMIIRPEYMGDVITNEHVTRGLVGFVDGSGNPYPYTTPEEIWGNLETASVHDELLRINHYTFRDESFLHDVKVPRVIFLGRPPEREFDMNSKYYNVEEDYLIKNVISEAVQNLK